MEPEKRKGEAGKGADDGPNRDVATRAEGDSVTRAPESGEPEDRLVRSTRRLEKKQHGSGGDKSSEKDDVRDAPESGR